MSCSFCKSRNHNISYCDSPTIPILFETMKAQWINYLNTLQFTDSLLHFKNFISRRFCLRQLKAVAVHYMNCLASTRKKEIINIICSYFRFIRISSSQQVSELTQLPVVSDPIPDFAQDLENFTHEETDVTPINPIRWYIDRRPMTIQREEYNSEYRSAFHLIPPPPMLPFRRQQADISEEMPIQNLNAEFNSVARKYKITPVLLVKENENLENCEECPICYEPTKIIDTVEFGCSHRFCDICVKNILQKHNKPEAPCCALCRGTIKTCSIINVEIYNKIVEYCDI